MYASALPIERRSSEICVKINSKPEKNFPNIIDRTLKKINCFNIILITLLTLWLTFHSVVHFSCLQ